MFFDQYYYLKASLKHHLKYNLGITMAKIERGAGLTITASH